MTFEQIKGYQLINKVDETKVNQIAQSIKNNGYVGCPILVINEQLLSGSHRLAALRSLDEQGIDVDNLEVAEDVTDLVNEAFENYNKENGYCPDLDYSDIGWMLKGTWVEEYKNEIEEW